MTLDATAVEFGVEASRFQVKLCTEHCAVNTQSLTRTMLDRPYTPNTAPITFEVSAGGPLRCPPGSEGLALKLMGAFRLDRKKL